MRSSSVNPFPFPKPSASAQPGCLPASGQAPGGAAAGLVPYKTSGPDFLAVSFEPEIVQERRVRRLRRQVWAAGHLHRFACPNGFRENVWFVTLTYRGVDDWRPGHISRCFKAIRKWCKKQGVSFRYQSASNSTLVLTRSSEVSLPSPTHPKREKPAIF